MARGRPRPTSAEHPQQPSPAAWDGSGDAPGLAVPSRAADGRARRVTAALAMLVLTGLALAATLLLVQRQADALRQQEQASWETRLLDLATALRDGLEADGDDDVAALAEVAESPTIALFLTEMREQGGDLDRIMDGPEQLDYIRNDLAVVAAEHGYQVGDGPPAVDANLPERASPEPEAATPAPEPITDTTSLILGEFAFEGIALVNLVGDTIVATDEFPPLTYDIRTFILEAARGQSHDSIAYDAPDGRPLFMSLQPAYGFLDNERAESQQGWILGLRLLEEVFDTGRLLGREDRFDTLQAVAVRRHRDMLTGLSPLRDGTPGATLMLTDAQAPAWAEALRSPGTSGLFRDIGGGRVIAASAGFHRLPVAIVTSIDTGEALAGAARLGRQEYLYLAPVALLGLGGCLLVWLTGGAGRRGRSS
ncbi:MAG: hypothetical protein R3F55_13800 [Alphaproteobacteria bacterium]